jgi:hypothetical protein
VVAVIWLEVNIHIETGGRRSLGLWDERGREGFVLKSRNIHFREIFMIQDAEGASFLVADATKKIEGEM